MTATFIGALLIPLALLWKQNVRLRREVQSLRPAANESSRAAFADAKSAQRDLSTEERQRFRLEHLELLSLRGRVNQLTKELRQKNASNAASVASHASPQSEADSILFSAALTNRVPSGHTLVAGGWRRDGMRGYLLATPIVLQTDTVADEKQLTLRSQVVGAPESFWEQIGWGSARSDTRRSSVAGVITPDQLDTLLNALRETKDAEISNVSQSAGRCGEPMGFGFAQDDGPGVGTLMSIDLRPQLSPDGLSVELALSPSAVSTNTPIHSALRRTQESGSSATR